MAGMASSATEAEVYLAASGDRDAFARLVTATRSLVSSIAIAELRDMDAARDVAQDVYLQVWNDLGALRNPSSFLPFLRQVTRQRARRVAELRAREVRGPDADESLEGAVDPAEDPSGQLLRSERVDIVRQALDALPDDSREIVALYYLEGHSATQVARLLGLREEAVYQRLSRARARLRIDVLERLGDSLSKAAPGAAFTAAVMAALPTKASALGAGLVSTLSTVTGKATFVGVVVALIAVLAVFVSSSGGRGGPAGHGGGGSVSIARPHQPATREDASPSPPPDVALAVDGIEVRVTAARRPVAAADVQLYRRVPVDPATGQPAWQVSRSVKAGPEGRVRLTAPPGAYLVTARSPGFAPGQVEVVRPSGEPVTFVEVELATAATLIGRVTASPSGEAVPLATLSLERESILGSRAANLPLAERFGTLSDPNGHFSVAGLAPGHYRLVAEAAGHARTTLRQVVVPRHAPLDVALGSAGIIEGRVVLANGSPASGAEVIFVGGPELLTVTTGLRGGFAAEVQPGSYRVSAVLGIVTGAFAKPVPVAAGGAAKGVDIRLGAASSIAGRVTDASGSPIVGAQVTLSPGGESGESAGTLTRAPGTFEVGPLAPGEYDLTVRADGHSPAVRSGLVVLAGQRFEIVVRMDGVGSVEGTVRDQDGAPVEGVRVRGGKLWGGGLGSVTAEAVTGAEGRYLLSGLEVGVAEIRAWRPEVAMTGSKPVLVEAGRRSTADFVLPATGTLEGEIRFSVAPPPDTTVIVELVPDQQQMRSRDFGRIEVGEDRQFRVELPVGALRVFAATSDGKATNDWVNTRVEAGKTTRLELVLKADSDDPTRLTVDVREPGGAPAGDASLVLWEPDFMGLTTADAAGHAELMRTPGPATVTASKGGRVSRPIDVAAETRELVVELQPEASIRGRVVSNGGSTVQGFTALVEPAAADGANIHRGVRHQFTGDHFELTDVRSGPVHLVVTTSDGRVGQVSLLLSPGESAERNVTVQPAGVILVRPVSVDGHPVDGAYVILGSHVIDTATGGIYFEHGALQNGVVVVENVPSGTNEIRIGAHMYKEAARTVEVAPGQTLDLGAVVIEPQVAPGGDPRK
jgi:RNA polymerase sigma factor (sigma-70 family)